MKREDFMKLVATGALTPVIPATVFLKKDALQTLKTESDHQNADFLTKVVASIVELLKTPIDSDHENIYVIVLGYYKPGDGGEGGFYWDANESKKNHNGGTIIDPGHSVNISVENKSWFQPENTSDGCWKRVQTNFVNVEWFGCKGDYDGSAGSDDTNGLHQAFNYASQNKVPVKNLNKKYVCNKTIEVDYLNLEGQGEIIRTAPADKPVLSVKGNITEYSPVESDIFISTNTIKDANLAAHVVEGDLLLITSNKNFGDKRLIRPQGEICRVRRVSTKTIYTSDVRQDTYLKSDKARVAKILPATFKITGNLTINHKPANPKQYTRGIEIAYCLEPTASISFKNITRHAFVSYSCYKPTITVNSDNNGVLDPGAPNTGEGQPIIINGATMYGKFYGSGFYTRHTIAAGAAPEYPGVSWENHVIDFVGVGGGDTQVFDAHSQVGSIYFENCTAIGGTISDPDIADKNPSGFQLGARRNYIKDCTTINCRFSVLVRNDAHAIEVFDIEDLRIERGNVGFGFNNPSLNLDNLIINNLSADFSDSDNGTAIILRDGKISRHRFSNIDVNNGNLIDVNANVSLPESLIIQNAHCGFTSKKDNSDNRKAVIIDNNNINHIRLSDVHTENSSTLLSVSVPLKLVELINVDGSNADTNYIYFNGDINTMVVRGGSFINANTKDAALIKINNQKTMVNADLHPSQISGTNLTNLIEGPGSLNRYTLGGSLESITNLFKNIKGDLLEVTSGSFKYPSVLSGYGKPEGNISASIGTQYIRKDQEAGNTFYIKESGTGNTGWIVK